MAIPVQQFPILSFEQANPLLAGMQSANSIYSGLLQNQNQRNVNKYQPDMLAQQLQKLKYNNDILAPQAQYAPQMTQAELANKQAIAPHMNAETGLINQQSRYYGREAEARIGQMQASGELTRTQADFLRKTLPYKIQEAKASTFTDPILHRLSELQYAQNGAIDPELLKQIGVGQPQGDQQGNQQINGLPNIPMNGGSMNQDPLANALQQSMGANGLPPTPINAPKAFQGSALSNWALSGSPYGPLQQMQMKSLEHQMVEEAKTGVHSYNTVQTSASEAADQAVDMKRDVEKFNDAYSRLNTLERGPVAGKGPAVTGAAKDAEAASSKMLATYARMAQQGHITNTDFELFKSLKLNREMTPDSVKTMSKFTNMMADRLQERPEFLNTARKLGLNAQEAQTLWTRYDNDRPIFDYKTKTPLTKNLSTWQSFLTPQKINDVREGKREPVDYSDKKADSTPDYSNMSLSELMEERKRLAGGA
jgi:hypothetical protein